MVSRVSTFLSSAKTWRSAWSKEWAYLYMKAPKWCKMRGLQTVQKAWASNGAGHNRTKIDAHSGQRLHMHVTECNTHIMPKRSPTKKTTFRLPTRVLDARPSGCWKGEAAQDGILPASWWQWIASSTGQLLLWLGRWRIDAARQNGSLPRASVGIKAEKLPGPQMLTNVARPMLRRALSVTSILRGSRKNSPVNETSELCRAACFARDPLLFEAQTYERLHDGGCFHKICDTQTPTLVAW